MNDAAPPPGQPAPDAGLQEEAPPAELPAIVAKRRRPWIVFALEDALLDTRAGRLHVINALSTATPADVALFEATGEYDDPWVIARAAGTWVRAGRPRPLPLGGWRVVVNQCGGDPGDLDARARTLWELRGWKAEAPRVEASRLAQLAEVAQLGIVTHRDRQGLARAEQVLGHAFAAATTREDGVRPDPQVLLRHGPTGHFIGIGEEDRATAKAARFVFHDATAGLAPIVDKMILKLTT
ncbi:MAG: hypothetical protein Q8P18_07190 [Pseudomonadota bacterium]|nr:hypothetical protein [Pseudomonadota bacterium]